MELWKSAHSHCLPVFDSYGNEHVPPWENRVGENGNPVLLLEEFPHFWPLCAIQICLKMYEHRFAFDGLYLLLQSDLGSDRQTYTNALGLRHELNDKGAIWSQRTCLIEKLHLFSTQRYRMARQKYSWNDIRNITVICFRCILGTDRF